MYQNLIIGCLTIAVNVVVQCFVLSFVLRALFVLEKREAIRPTLVLTSSLLIGVMLIILIGNVLQMTLWAGLFIALGEFNDFSTAFYHSMVNFTTLGYGDLVMSKAARMLGAFEAANGVLMFGLTTGFLYTVLSALMRRAWDVRLSQDGQP